MQHLSAWMQQKTSSLVAQILLASKHFTSHSLLDSEGCKFLKTKE